MMRDRIVPGGIAHDLSAAGAAAVRAALELEEEWELVEVSVHQTLRGKNLHRHSKSHPRYIQRRCLHSKFDHIESWRWSMIFHNSCSSHLLDLVEEEMLEDSLVMVSVEVEWVRWNKAHFDSQIRSMHLLFHTIQPTNNSSLGNSRPHMLHRRNRHRSAIGPRRVRGWKGGRRGLVAS